MYKKLHRDIIKGNQKQKGGEYMKIKNSKVLNFYISFFMIILFYLCATSSVHAYTYSYSVTNETSPENTGYNGGFTVPLSSTQAIDLNSIQSSNPNASVRVSGNTVFVTFPSGSGSYYSLGGTSNVSCVFPNSSGSTCQAFDSSQASTVLHGTIIYSQNISAAGSTGNCPTSGSGNYMLVTFSTTCNSGSSTVVGSHSTAVAQITETKKYTTASSTTSFAAANATDHLPPTTAFTIGNSIGASKGGSCTNTDVSITLITGNLAAGQSLTAQATCEYWKTTITYTGTAYFNYHHYTYNTTISLNYYDIPVPNPPSNLLNTAGNASVSSSWTGVTNATSYHYSIGIGGIGEVQSGNTTGTNTTFVNLKNGASYQVCVSSVGISGTSSPTCSSLVSPHLPSVSGLTASAGNGTVSLNWPSVSGATGYQIYKNNTLLTTTTNPTYVFNGVNGTTYSFYVTAYDANEISSPSNTVTATPHLPSASGLSGFASNGYASLSWNGVSGATGYQIYKNGSYYTSTTNTSYVYYGSNGTSYTFCVYAYDGGEVSAGTNTVSVMPRIPATNITATAYYQKITLNWTPVTGVSRYEIYQDNVMIANFSPSIVTYDVNGLVNGQNYSFFVKTIDATDSNSSNTVTASPYLAAPVISVTEGNQQLFVNWASISGAIGYDLYVDGMKYNTTRITSTTYTINGLQNFKNYTMTVKSTDGFGYSNFSNAVTTSPKLPVPTLTLVANGNQFVDVSWNAITNAAGYNLYNGTTKVNATLITNTNYHITGLINYTINNFTVKAADSLGESVSSNIIIANGLLDKPTLLSAISGNKSIAVTWSSVLNTTGYNVYVNGIKNNISSIFSTGYMITSGISNGINQQITVTAIDTKGESFASDPMNATPLLPKPSKPTVLTVGNGQITIQWVTVPNATSYNLYIDSVKINTSPISGLTYTVNNLISFQNYQFQISAVDATSESMLSDSLISQAVLPAPSNIQIQNYNGSFLVIWDQVSNATTYNIYVDNVKQVVTPSPIFTNAYVVTISNKINYQSYQVRVSSLNSIGESTLSPSIIAMPKLDAPALTLSRIGNQKVNVSWTTVPNATGYNVYRGTSKVNAIPINLNSFEITGLTNYSSYTITIKSTDVTTNESNASNAITATPILDAPIVSVSSVGNQVVTLSWLTVPNASGYNLYKNGVKYNTSLILTTQTSITGLNNGIEYSFTVRATDLTTNESLDSNVVKAKPGIPVVSLLVPNVRISYTNPDHTKSNLTFSWTYSDPAGLPQQQSSIDVWTVSSSGVLVTNVIHSTQSGTSLSYLVANGVLNKNQLYAVTIRGFNGQTWSDSWLSYFMTDVNEAPIIDFTVPITVIETDSIAFTNKTTDADGDVLTYVWTVKKNGITSQTNTATNATILFDAATTYTIQLTATDGINAPVSKIVTITVNPLVFLGTVSHTTTWEKNRLRWNQIVSDVTSFPDQYSNSIAKKFKTTRASNVFFAGEKLLLSTRLNVTGEKMIASFAKSPNTFQTTLISNDGKSWSGSLTGNLLNSSVDVFDQLPNGTYQVTFTLTRNGLTRVSIVSFIVSGKWTTYTNTQRRY